MHADPSLQPRNNPPIPLGNICVVAFTRGDGNFHWTIAVTQRHWSKEFHATNRADDNLGWIYKPWAFEVRDSELQRSLHAAVIVTIGAGVFSIVSLNYADVSPLSGRLGNNTTESLEALLQDIPMKVVDPGEARTQEFNAKMWVRQAIRVLHGAGVINCPDVLALEEEILEYANENDIATGLGAPFKLHTASNVID